MSELRFQFISVKFFFLIFLTLATCGSHQSKPHICSWLHASRCCTSWCTVKQGKRERAGLGAAHAFTYNKHTILAKWPKASTQFLWLTEEDRALSSPFWSDHSSSTSLIYELKISGWRGLSLTMTSIDFYLLSPKMVFIVHILFSVKLQAEIII